MKITIANLQKKPLTARTLNRLARRILKHEKISLVELSIVFVNERLIRRLNSQFLKKSHPTDVLSFDLSEKKDKVLRGEIIISTDAAQQFSRLFHTNFNYELVLYLIHGILHLLGFDDTSPAKAKQMRRKETQLLKYLKITL